MIILSWVVEIFIVIGYFFWLIFGYDDLIKWLIIIIILCVWLLFCICRLVFIYLVGFMVYLFCCMLLYNYIIIVVVDFDNKIVCSF